MWKNSKFLHMISCVIQSRQKKKMAREWKRQNCLLKKPFLGLEHVWGKRKNQNAKHSSNDNRNFPNSKLCPTPHATAARFPNWKAKRRRRRSAEWKRKIEGERDGGGVKNNPLGTRWRHFQEAKICQYRETQHKPEAGHKETGRQGKDTKDLCPCYGLFAWLGERAGRQRQRTLAGAVKAYRYTNIT